MMKMQEIMDDFVGPFCFLGGTISFLVIHIVIISTISVYLYR